MSELSNARVEGDSQDEALMRAYDKANEVFDEQDAIEEAAARIFGVTVEYVRRGYTGLRPTPRFENRMKRRYKEAGWDYLEK